MSCIVTVISFKQDVYEVGNFVMIHCGRPLQLSGDDLGTVVNPRPAVAAAWRDSGKPVQVCRGRRKFPIFICLWYMLPLPFTTYILLLLCTSSMTNQLF